MRGLGAGEIAFDVDFSAPSAPEQDAALQAALERADGSVILVAFDQRETASAAGAPLHANRPIDRFADNAWLASVNVVPDADGRIRRLDNAGPAGQGDLPSLAAMLAGPSTASPSSTCSSGASTPAASPAGR